MFLINTILSPLAFLIFFSLMLFCFWFEIILAQKTNLTFRYLIEFRFYNLKSRYINLKD